MSGEEVGGKVGGNEVGLRITGVGKRVGGRVEEEGGKAPY